MVQGPCLRNVYSLGPCQGYLWTVWGLCLAQLYFKTTWSSKICNTESTWSKANVYGVYTLGSRLGHIWTMLGPCLTYLYFKTSQSSKIVRTESTWSKANFCVSLNLCGHVKSMFTPCFDHILPSFTSRPTRALKLSTMSQNGLRPKSMEQIFFGTVSGLCLDHYFQMRQSPKMFKTESPWSKANFYLVSACQGHFQAIFVPYRPSFASRPARDTKCSTQSQRCLWLMSIECLDFGALSGHFGTTFGPCFAQL